MTIKLFEMDEQETWAARTREEAIEEFKKHSDLDDESTVREITDNEMDSRKIIDCETNKEIGTYREYLQKMIDAGDEFPCLFSVSEW